VGAQVKIGIAAHEKRIGMAYNLFHEVDADFINVDNGSLGCEGCHRRVWEQTAAIADDDEWIIVMEDDAVPVENFRQQAEQALAVTPAGTDVVSFYLGQMRPSAWQQFVRQAVAQADSSKACWITSDTALHAVALAIRNKHVVAQMLSRTAESTRPIDERITLWCRQFGHASAYTWPSLVDHRDEDPVIVRRADGAPRERGRVAWQVGRRDLWTARSVKLRP
jgi:GR25 family glycosyltransferase involved in LPS biosynthesis